MPDAAVYRWDDLAEDRPMPLVARRRIIGDRMMISRVFLSAGCAVPTHSHANEQFACVCSGRVRFGLGAPGSPGYRTVTLGPGEVLHLPADVPHSANAEEDSIVLDLFSPPSATTGIDVQKK